MATRTSVGSGLWSSAGTWDTGVPQDSDDVIISSGHEVTFNVDQSSFVTGVKITITGTLTHTTSAGTYVMMIKTGDSITGAGTWNIGTSGNPIPYNSKHTITGIAGFRIIGSSGLTINVYGAKPAVRYATLTQTAAQGTKVLTVDRDVSADLWASGDIVTVGRYIANNAENNTFASATPTTITLGTNLATAMEAGSVVALVSRNIEFVYNSTGALLYNFTASGKLTLDGCCLRTTYSSQSGRCFQIVYYATLTEVVTNRFGNVFYDASQNSCYRCVFTATSVTAISFTYSTTYHYYLEDCGICGYDTAITFFSWLECRGGFAIGGTYGIYSCSDSRISDFTVSTAMGLLQTGFNLVLRNVKINSPTFSSRLGGDVYSYDHNQVAGAYLYAGTYGYAEKQTGTKPTGYSYGFRMYRNTGIGAPDYPFVFGIPVHADAGESITIEVQLYKTVSQSFLPRAMVSNGYAPSMWVRNTSEVLDSFTMTDSTNTWESDTFTVTNTSTHETVFKLDFVFFNSNGSGNVYCAYKVTRSASGGGIPRSRLLGGV